MSRTGRGTSPAVTGELCAQRAKKPDLAELSEKSAALLEQTHVPFHSLTGSADEKDSEPVLDQAETELAGALAPLPPLPAQVCHCRQIALHRAVVVWQRASSGRAS